MQLFNTLTRKAEEITPLHDKTIKLYTCGLTVYSQPHIGNWVAYIYWDVLVRTLKANGYNVERVQNITDVGHLTSDEDAGEDKMLKSALKEGTTAWDVADKYIQIADHEAYDLLDLVRPDHMPRATDFIEQQKAFVQELSDKGFTYTIDDGIYFDTSKLKDYGKLARLDISGLQFGARVEDTGKKNPTDFAVWKFSAPNEKRDMEWDSPIETDRKGFPGWHLECSVMARELLGDQIDIHTGGIDHIPVHHTNEIAQTEAVTGKPFSTYWMHANHIKVDGTKMSKSLGNIYTLQDIINKGFDVQAFKLMVLNKHYQTEGNFTWEGLEEFQHILNDMYAWSDLQFQDFVSPKLRDNYTQALETIKSQLSTNLDTHAALATINGMVKRVEELGADSAAVADAVKVINELLGINLTNRSDITDEQKNVLNERQTARKNKDWAKSDELRDQLRQDGVEVKDTTQGQIWSKA